MRIGRDQLAAVVLLALGLVVFYQTVVRLDPRSTFQAILGPWPDAAEYLDGAVHLGEEGRHRIHVGGMTVPSRYPFGVSLLQASYIGLGGEPFDAPFAVNEAAGLALILSVFGYLAWRGHWLAAGLAAIILSTRTWLIVLCRSGMSEPPSLLLFFWAAVLLYRWAQSGRWPLGAGGAFLLALGSSLRLSTVLLFGFAAGALAAGVGAGKTRIMRGAATLAAGGLAGSLPILIYHQAVFGAPWRTGYGFWFGDYVAQTFGLDYISQNGLDLWLEMLQRETQSSVASMFGEGSYFSPSFAILAVIALVWAVQRRPDLLWFVASAVLYTSAMLVYKFGISRMYTPLALLAVPLVARFGAQLWRRLRTSGHPVYGLVWIVGLLVVLLGWPGSRSDADMGDMFKSRPLGMATRFGAIEILNLLPEDEQRVVITDADPPYVHALTRGRRRVAPMQPEHGYRFNPEAFSFGEEDRDRLISSCLNTPGCVVYAIYQRLPSEELDQQCPPPPGTQWEVVAEDNYLQGLARLVRE